MARGGGSGGGLVQGAGTPIADNKVVRGDSPDGLQGSLLEITDAGEGSGLTRLDVDNLRIDGNVISSTSANGDITLDPNGSGRVLFGADGGIGINADGDLTLANAANTGFSRLRLKGAASLSAGTSGALKVQSDDGATNWLRLDSAGVRLKSDGQVGFVAAGDLDAGVDAGIARAAAGVMLDTDGGAGLGRRLTGRVVEASTAGSGAPNLLTATESRTLFTNEGASAEAYNTLPVAAAGVGPFGFYCQNTNGIRVVANTGDTIRIEDAVSATAGFARSVTVGSLLWLECINAAEWVASCKPAGVWTIDL